MIIRMPSHRDASVNFIAVVMIEGRCILIANQASVFVLNGKFSSLVTIVFLVA